MAAALTIARRGRGGSSPNPNVGCVLVANGRVVGRGVTASGGRPHAEAAAVAEAGDSARGATAYVTLEPCAHSSARGPACADVLIMAGVARVVVAMTDPDPRTAGQGVARLRAAGVAVAQGVMEAEARVELAGFVSRLAGLGPHVTLKLALSLDGRAALQDGRSQWITGPTARAHGHLERLAADAVIVGRGTWDADAPALTVRLPGHIGRQPQRAVITASIDEHPGPSSSEGGDSVEDRADGGSGREPGVLVLPGLAAIGSHGWQRVLVEGGPALATAMLAADRVDRLLLYRAPILIGEGRGIAFRLHDLAAAHGRWTLADRRPLGPDVLEAYARAR